MGDRQQTYNNLGGGLAPQAADAPKDRTFLTYTSKQAEIYARQRGTYAPALYKVILDHHLSTNGKLGIRLDVGCGPGNSLRDIPLLEAFEKTIGIDPSPEMLKVAEKIEDDPLQGADAQQRKRITYMASKAEEIDRLPIEPHSVDLITVATAAHWFDMSAFWAAAANLLRPGGTVAIWIISRWYVHPSTENADKIQKELDHLEFDLLGPYTSPGNVLVRNAYDELVLPWTSNPKVDAFPQESFTRKDWNRNGEVEPGTDFFVVGGKGGGVTKLSDGHRAMETASAVTRWREAHPDLAGTDQDAVISTFEKVKALLPPNTDSIRTGPSTHLLLAKRK